MKTETCPHCGSSQLGEEIPEASRHYYGEDSTHFSRTILMEIQGVYDGGLFYACPDCAGRWHRWPEGHELRARAETYVNPKEIP